MPQIITLAAGSSAAQVQAAINAAPAHATIRLAAGAFNFTQTVVVDRSDITISGAGKGLTIITADASLHGAPAIRVGAPLFAEDKADPVRMALAPEGARHITLAQTPTLRVGDTIWIEQANDRALFDKIGDTHWREQSPLRTALAVVTEVHGKTLVLDRALPFTFQSAGTTVEKIHIARNVTLSDFTLRGDFGAANPADFTNPLPREDGGMLLLVNTTDNASIRHIALKNAASNAFVIAKSIDAAVDDLTVRGAHNKGSEGNGYGVWIRDVYDSDFRNLAIYDTRHAVLFASYTSAAGNTVHVRDTNRDINFHGGLDHDNVVTVDNSVRTGPEVRYMGAVSYVNPGTSFGAPTDPDANTIVFRNVVGTVRGDLVHAGSGAARIVTLSGADTIIGGNGSDSIRAGTGDDLIFASRGSDRINGGDGADTFRMDLWRSDVRFTVERGELVVRSALGTTHLVDVEGVMLNNDWYSTVDLMAQAQMTAFSDMGI
jgi:RTX calcium-binding nonapeptide repeat (4 copies)